MVLTHSHELLFALVVEVLVGDGGVAGTDHAYFHVSVIVLYNLVDVYHLNLGV